ncbi:MAG TPA: c-type cytochrome [Acidimicrobiales bacterium]|jgi:ubiquinol-cytochrome c reductase cytochrome c subunit|nr:c-type cytochrome [Acidimicrobiales bacterium]
MSSELRRRFKSRYAVLAGLLASVGIFGLMAFAPSAAQADPTTVTTTTLAPTTPGGLIAPTPTPTPTTPSTSTTTTTLATSSGPPDFGTVSVHLPESFIAPGQALFDASCASCHASDGSGTSRGPNLQGLGAGTIDFWVSTGRMPLADSSVQPAEKPSRFNRTETLQIAAFVQSQTPGTGVPVPVVDLSRANLELGGSLFTLNCAACHTITGAGDALAGGAYAPSLHLATPTQIVEAIRSGPGNMPRFGPGNLTDAEVHNIAAYVAGPIQHPDDRGGFGLGGIGPVGEGFVGLLLGVGVLMLVCFWIGDRT